MEFKTSNIKEFHAMITLAIIEGLSFSAEAEGDELLRVYIIKYTGAF